MEALGKNDELPGKNVEVPGKNVEVPGKNVEVTGKNLEVPRKNDVDVVVCLFVCLLSRDPIHRVILAIQSEKRSIPERLDPAWRGA